MYDKHKSRIQIREQEITFEKKVYESMIMTEKRTSLYLHIIFLTINISHFCPLSGPEYNIKEDEKE